MTCSCGAFFSSLFTCMRIRPLETFGKPLPGSMTCSCGAFFSSLFTCMRIRPLDSVTAYSCKNEFDSILVVDSLALDAEQRTAKRQETLTAAVHHMERKESPIDPSSPVQGQVLLSQYRN